MKFPLTLKNLAKIKLRCVILKVLMWFWYHFHIKWKIPEWTLPQACWFYWIDEFCRGWSMNFSKQKQKQSSQLKLLRTCRLEDSYLVDILQVLVIFLHKTNIAAARKQLMPQVWQKNDLSVKKTTKILINQRP